MKLTTSHRWWIPDSEWTQSPTTDSTAREDGFVSGPGWREFNSESPPYHPGTLSRMPATKDGPPPPPPFGFPRLCWARVTALMLFKSRVEWNIIKCLLNHTRLVTGRREWGIRQINCYSDSSTITRFAEDNNYVASSVWKYCLNLLPTCCLWWKTIRQKVLLVSCLRCRSAWWMGFLLDPEHLLEVNYMSFQIQKVCLPMFIGIN